MITFQHSGSFNSTEHFLKNAYKNHFLQILERYGREGVDALSKATPVDSGDTASSWTFEIVQNGSGFSIIWSNSNVIDGVPIVILLQYGHATTNGGYVQGFDFVNPAMQPIFEKIANDAWKEVNDI